LATLVGEDLTIINVVEWEVITVDILSSSDSFVVFGFSFDVLTQDCKLKCLDPFVMYISKSR